MGKYLLYPQDGKVRVTSPFGIRNGKMHRGVDIASDNVRIDWNLAAGDGVITRIGYEASGAGHWLEAKVGFPVEGKVAYIRYYHLKEVPHFYDRTGKPRIVAGDKIKQAEKIGIEGNTGHSSGSHLHFELRLGGNASSDAVDPVPYLWIPKELPIDGGALTKAQFKNVKYVEDFKEEECMTFKKGSEGDGVKAVQTIFKELGYNIGTFGPNKDGIDGKFGSTMVEATKKFQTTSKITASGEMNDSTLLKLAMAISDKAGKIDIAKGYSDKISSL